VIALLPLYERHFRPNLLLMDESAVRAVMGATAPAQRPDQVAQLGLIQLSAEDLAVPSGNGYAATTFFSWATSTAVSNSRSISGFGV
jgi:hypothetical protein